MKLLLSIVVEYRLLDISRAAMIKAQNHVYSCRTSAAIIIFIYRRIQHLKVMYSTCAKMFVKRKGMLVRCTQNNILKSTVA